MHGPPLRRRLRSSGLTFFLDRIAPWLGRHSWLTCQRWGRRLGGALWHLVRRERGRTLEHLLLAFPECTPSERRALGHACFEHLGTCVGEILHLLQHDCETVQEQVELSGWQHVEAAMESERPVVIMTGHCGNWELLAATINCRGLDMAVVARGQEDERMDRFLTSFRARFGTTTIVRSRPGAARQLLRQLRGGGALGMLIDQDTRVEGVWVPFFGRLAYTPVGAAQIALRQNAAVIPTFIERRGDGSHLARFDPPLELGSDPEEATAIMTRAIEEQIRRRPEQWVWMHRRWRRRPPPEASAEPQPLPRGST